MTDTTPSGDDGLSAPHVLEYAYKRSLGPVLGRFFTGLRDGKIEGIRTRAGRVLVPPSEYDPETGEATPDDFVEVGPGGVVKSWAWVSAPRTSHPLPHPFAFALVELDGADTSFLHALAVDSVDAVSIGMRVKPSWREEPRGHVTDLECFVPE